MGQSKWRTITPAWLIFLVISFVGCHEGTAENFSIEYPGQYRGKERLTANYGQTLISETTKVINVTPGQDADEFVIDGDEVIIDETGRFPYPSCCGYRFYSVRFWSDSISIYKNFGPLGSASESSFRGKKI